MKNLSSQWPRIISRLKRARHIVVLLDYDGTLSPIVRHPDKAFLDKELKSILVSLARMKKVHVGIISGRALSKVKKLAGIKGIYYAGDHGLEIKGQGINFVHPAYARYSSFIKKIGKALKRETKSIKGAIIEAKLLTITVHYRLVAPNEVKTLKAIFDKVSRPLIKSKRIKVSTGKRLWEIKPPVDWDKGKAVKKILSGFKDKSILTIYMGDDLTDEDAFRALRNKAYTVYIGSPNKKTHASYNLRSVSGVKSFFKRLIALLDKHGYS